MKFSTFQRNPDKMIELYKFSFEADGSMELTQTRSELSNSVTVGSVTSTRQCIDAAKRMFRRIIVITQGELFFFSTQTSKGRDLEKATRYKLDRLSFFIFHSKTAKNVKLLSLIHFIFGLEKLLKYT